MRALSLDEPIEHSVLDELGENASTKGSEMEQHTELLRKKKALDMLSHTASTVHQSQIRARRGPRTCGAEAKLRYVQHEPEWVEQCEGVFAATPAAQTSRLADAICIKWDVGEDIVASSSHTQ